MAQMKKPLAEEAMSDAVWKAGYETGFARCRNNVLTFLEQKYLAPDAPDRGSPEGNAILELARELNRMLNK